MDERIPSRRSRFPCYLHEKRGTFSSQEKTRYRRNCRLPSWTSLSAEATTTVSVFGDGIRICQRYQLSHCCPVPPSELAQQRGDLPSFRTQQSLLKYVRLCRPKLDTEKLSAAHRSWLIDKNGVTQIRSVTQQKLRRKVSSTTCDTRSEMIQPQKKRLMIQNLPKSLQLSSRGARPINKTEPMPWRFQ